MTPAETISLANQSTPADYRARYYGSVMARFLTPDDGDGGDSDPSAPQSWNLYAYVQNNPLTNTDPDGHDCVVQSRTSDTTENVTVSSGNCDNVSVGDGQTKTYVAGTVDVGSIQGNGSGGITFNYTSYSGDAGVASFNGAPVPDRPGLAYNWGNNAQGYQMLAGAANVVNKGTAIGVGIYAAAFAGAAYGPAAIAGARGAYYALMGLLPAVPSAVEKLQRLGMSLQEANEVLENPSTERYVDNANGGNINYFLNTGSRIIRITTDPNGKRIISAGIVQGRNIANGIATGRFTR